MQLSVVQSPPPPGTDELNTIETYLDTKPASFAPCREGQHYCPPGNPSTMRFKRRADGYDVWRSDCEICGAVYREEVWLILENVDGIVIRMELISKTTKYYALGKDAESYLLPPGSGRISKREFRQARVGRQFIGKPVKREGRRSQGG